MSGDYQVRALARGLAILTSFTLTHPEQSLTAISTRLGLAKGTAVRLLTVLEEHGFVERAASERYRLGVRLFELGSIYEQTFSIEQAARPALEVLAKECQQTANLGILNAGQVVHVAVVPPQRPIHFAGQLGARELVHCTGLGKALIADLVGGGDRGHRRRTWPAEPDAADHHHGRGVARPAVGRARARLRDRRGRVLPRPQLRRRPDPRRDGRDRRRHQRLRHDHRVWRDGLRTRRPRRRLHRFASPGLRRPCIGNGTSNEQ